MARGRGTSELARRVDELSDWLDQSLALGLSGWTREHLLIGRSREVRLRQAGLDQLAEGLARVLSASPGNRTAPFGRLLVIHDITRERVFLDEPWSAKEGM